MKLDPNWIAGFVDGEGTFYVGINPNATMTAKFQVLPEFRVVQHERDIQLLYALKKYFGYGTVRRNHGDRFEFRVRKHEALLNKIIPFFTKYKLHTKKKLDFLKFRKVVLKMDRGDHLTETGILEIFKIAKTMNRGEKSKTKQHLDKEKVRSSGKPEASSPNEANQHK